MQVLSWPIEWSALHGIAELKTPILRASVTTDVTHYKYMVFYPGIFHPNVKIGRIDRLGD